MPVERARNRSQLTGESVWDGFTRMPSLTRRIPDSLELQLVAASKERGTSKIDVVREENRDMRVQAWQKLRDQFALHLERQSIRTENDVFTSLAENP